MEITDIQIVPVAGNERLKGYATIKIDGCLIVREIKIINGPNGYFVSMPSKRMKDGKYLDMVHPLDRATREVIEDVILAEYVKVCSRRISCRQLSTTPKLSPVPKST